MIRVVRETHETPDWATRALRLAGGVNRFGRNNYRVVWGWNRLTWIGGKWEDRNSAGDLLREVVELREEPKYAPPDRWHLERWVPPEGYGSPRAWFANTIEIENGLSIPALGPYPSRGEYEHCFTLEDPRGEFVQLTPEVIAHIARAIEWSRGLAPSVRKSALTRRNEHEEHSYDAYADAVLSDPACAFHGAPFVTVH
ncbi:MAG TPA: hypothetical protein VEH50_07535 [Methylomirabilota bacterium]|nr:hypothetical protein [Methylomirabilota bacterium]